MYGRIMIAIIVLILISQIEISKGFIIEGLLLRAGKYLVVDKLANYALRKVED